MACYSGTLFSTVVCGFAHYCLTPPTSAFRPPPVGVVECASQSGVAVGAWRLQTGADENQSAPLERAGQIETWYEAVVTSAGVFFLTKAPGVEKTPAVITYDWLDTNKHRKSLFSTVCLHSTLLSLGIITQPCVEM